MIIDSEKKSRKIRGIYKPLNEEIEFKASWGNHEFTDEECKRLLKGGEVTFLAKSSAGMSYIASGKLEYQSYKGKTFWGFKRDVKTKDNDKIRDKDLALNSKLFSENEKMKGVYTPTNEIVQFNRKWAGHHFNDDECRQLLSGLSVTFTAFSRNGRQFTVTGSLKQQKYKGKNYWGFARDVDAIPNEWQGHRFTKQEMEELRNGDVIYIPDAVSTRSKRPLRCTLCYTQVDGKKKLVPVRV